MVLHVVRAEDDGAKDFIAAKTQVTQQVVDQQLEAVAIVTVAAKRVFQRRPVIDRPVFDVVLFCLFLNPIGQISGESALAFLTECIVLGPEVAGRRLRGLGIRAGSRYRGECCRRCFGVIGPLARSAEDLRLALEVIAGPDTLDQDGWTLELPPPRAERLEDFRVGFWLDDPLCPIDSEVRTELEATIEALRPHVQLVDIGAPPDLAMIVPLPPNPPHPPLCLQEANKVTTIPTAPHPSSMVRPLTANWAQTVFL